jgi:type I restriction enzyme S subunit
VKVGTFIPDGVPVIRGGDIRNGRISFDDSKRVSPEISEQFRRTILKGGEILVNLIGEAGHSAIVPRSLAGSNVSRDVAVIAIGRGADAKFVDYYLKSPQVISWLHSRLQGSVTQKINLGTLKALPVPAIHVNEQRAIASVLGALDNKIELNRKMSATLEAMAQALFKSWFVDFDPTHAKAEGRDPSLTREVVDLFPGAFTNDGVGRVPAGWSVRGLDQVATFLNGLALQKFPPVDGEATLPVIKISQLRAGHSIGADRAAADLSKDFVVANGDILFSWSGSLECRIWTGGLAP